MSIIAIVREITIREYIYKEREINIESIIYIGNARKIHKMAKAKREYMVIYICGKSQENKISIYIYIGRMVNLVGKSQRVSLYNNNLNLAMSLYRGVFSYIYRPFLLYKGILLIYTKNTIFSFAPEFECFYYI